MSFGPHLLFDLSECQDIEKLRDNAFIKEFLLKLVDICKMTLIMGPHTHKFRGDDMDQDGISGILVIAESHISIHTAPENKTCSIDIFSCKDFDYWEGISYIVSSFKPLRFHYDIVQRGNSFPRYAQEEKKQLVLSS